MSATPSVPSPPPASAPPTEASAPAAGDGSEPVLSAPLPVADERRPSLGAPYALEDLPASASARRLLRGALPAIYQDGPDCLAMRFLEGLEHVLDPRVAVIDCRAAYLDSDLAPDAMVREMASWLGFEADELPPQALRRLLANANQLARSRGTKHGVELALTCCFPHLHFQLEDRARPRSPSTPAESGDPRLVMRCREALDPQQQTALGLLLDRQCPIDVEVEIHEGDATVEDDRVHQVASWLGLDLERLPAETFRRLLAHAHELASSRGTRRGIELALTFYFPHLHFEAEDADENGGAGLVVKCRETLNAEQRAAIEGFLERQLPRYGKFRLTDGDPSTAREEEP